MIIPLEPHLEGQAEKRFFSVAHQIMGHQKRRQPSHIPPLVEAEARRAAQDVDLNGQAERYVACVRVLGDLAQLRWSLEESAYGLELHSPMVHEGKVRTPDEARARKDAIRAELRPRVHQQFEDKAVRAFIRQMESPSSTARHRSIKALIADGAELQARLAPARAAPAGSDARETALRAAVRPYLQLVDGNTRDAFTSIPLQDVWRYLRYTWSIPQTPIPGRKLHYLVRDAAHSHHAIIGIAALSNCAVQMVQRDRQIGWSARGLEAALQNLFTPPADRVRLKHEMDLQGVYRALLPLVSDRWQPTEEDKRRVATRVYDWLLEGLADALGDIEWSGLVTEAEIRSLSQDVISRLRKMSGEFASQRQAALSGEWLDDEPGDEAWGLAPVADELLQLEAKHATNKPVQDSRRMLVRKKRAAELARLLDAERILRDHADALTDPDRVFQTLEREGVRAAVNTAMAGIKSKRIGTGLLEITTCGAVAPYTHVLGGKLVALMLLSPKVAEDYRERYGTEPTIIRSQLKNAPVVPDNTLVWLGTTSLFAHGSSQYERLRLPAGVIAPDQPDIRFRPLGVTTGYGTVQFSDDTVKAVEAVMRKQRGYRDVNSVFGEGASPKLRKLRSGLDNLGFNSGLLLMHHQERLIYGVPFYDDAASYLCGLQSKKPSFVAHPERFGEAQERIAEVWRNRWLAGRLDHAETWEAVGSASTWTLSAELPDLAPPAVDLEPLDAAPPPAVALASSDAEELAFWRRLAQAGPNAIAEGLGDGDFERLHLPSTSLEAELVDAARRGASIVLTGNAGDGKTHLARIIQRELGADAARVEFAFDATAIMSRDAGVRPVVELWRRARQAGKGMVLAVNQYPLYLLRQQLRSALPDISAALEREWAARLIYHAGEEPEASDVRLVDLSLRNPLAADFAGRALQKMLSRPAIQRLAETNSDPNFTFNYRHLSDPLVRERLLALFGRVVSAGGRATVRELWILCARLLFGREEEPEAAGVERSRYSERLFELDARFALSTWLRKSADPAGVTHPQLDRRLESPTGTKASEWRVDGELPEQAPGRLMMAGMGDQGRERYRMRFTATKRLFYFEHEHGGDAVFALDDSAEARFHALLQDTRDDPLHLQELIASINRAYFPADFEGCREKLCLWIGHRLDEQPTSSYVANESIAARRLGLWRPRPAHTVGEGLAYVPDHLLLGLRKPDGRVAVESALRVDAQLFSTLAALRQGLPRHLINPGELNRLDAFIDRLRVETPDVAFEFLTYNAEHVQPALIQMSPSYDRYLSVRRLDR